MGRGRGQEQGAGGVWLGEPEAFQILLGGRASLHSSGSGTSPSALKAAAAQRPSPWAPAV